MIRKLFLLFVLFSFAGPLAAQRAPPEWDGVPRRAREARADTCVYWTLRLARGLADAPVPAGVVDALRPRGPAWVLHRLERHLAATLAGEAECPSPWLCRCLWEAAVRPRHAGAKLCMLVHKLADDIAWHVIETLVQ